MMKKREKNEIITLNKNMMEPVMQFEAGHIYTNDGSVVPIDPRIMSTFDTTTHELMKKVMETKKPDFDSRSVQAYNSAMNMLLDNRVRNCVYIHMVAFDSRVAYLINRVTGLLSNYTTPDRLEHMTDNLRKAINDCGAIHEYRIVTYRHLRELLHRAYDPTDHRANCEVELNEIFTTFNVDLDSAAMVINNNIWKVLFNPIMPKLDPEIINYIMDAYTSLFSVFMQDMIYEQNVLLHNVTYMDMTYYDKIDNGRTIDEFEF